MRDYTAGSCRDYIICVVFVVFPNPADYLKNVIVVQTLLALSGIVCCFFRPAGVALCHVDQDWDQL